MFLTSAQLTLPSKSFQRHVRPHWDALLRQAHGLSKRAHTNWVASGKALDPLDACRMRYKEAKRKFRQEIRRYERNQLDAFFASLDLSGNHCFRLILNYYGKSMPSTNSLLVDDILYEGSQIANAWAKYFHQLASPDWSMYDPADSIDTESRLLELLVSTISVPGVYRIYSL